LDEFDNIIDTKLYKICVILDDYYRVRPATFQPKTYYPTTEFLSYHSGMVGSVSSLNPVTYSNEFKPTIIGGESLSDGYKSNLRII
jgi:hypothetical protein